jgi:hypothetical protein
MPRSSDVNSPRNYQIILGLTAGITGISSFGEQAKSHFELTFATHYTLIPLNPEEPNIC